MPHNVSIDQNFDDWLKLHGLMPDEIQFCLERLGVRRPQIHTNTDRSVDLDFHLDVTEAWDLISCALSCRLPGLRDQIEFVAEWTDLNPRSCEHELPFTLQRKEGQPPYISMHYDGKACDVLCLAHEFGHALQFNLIDGAFLPPVLRELAAFLSELIVIDYIKAERTDLVSQVLRAWDEDSSIFFGRDKLELSASMRSPASRYNYRWNYPLARAGSVFAQNHMETKELSQIFKGEISTKDLVSLFSQFTKDFELENYLPPVSQEETLPGKIQAYRSLGMMALLDVDLWQGESELSIDEYYSERLRHLQEHSCFVALGEDHRPFGYVLWDADKNEKGLIHLRRQTAPFGNHLALQKQAEARLPKNTKVISTHQRSARKEQIAW